MQSFEIRVTFINPLGLHMSITAGIAVKDLPDEIDMEVDVRWCGDANISLGIELPVGG